METKTEGKMAQEKMTERILTVVLTLVVAGVLGVVGTALSGGALIRALGGVTEAQFQARIGTPGTPGSAGVAEFPEGTVVAFDLPTGCPEGWTEFVDAAGRMIIGQGSGMVGGTGELLTARKYRGHGGEETHKLTKAEMPSHQHEFSDSTVGATTDPDGDVHEFLQYNAANGGAGRKDYHMKQQSLDAGGGQSHNNMPPFIALYFCKKV